MAMRRFFAYITTNAPHAPFIAPPKNTKRFTDLGFTDKPAGFYGMIENIDENMGRLMGKLKEWNLYEDTILIFMSDKRYDTRWLPVRSTGGQGLPLLQRRHEGHEGQCR